jgi:hypothetical protein
MSEKVTTNLVVGSFGPEVSLIVDAGERRELNQLAAAADPDAIGALYPAVEHLAIGEELFGAGAQVTNKTRYTLSLKIEDMVRFILAIVIVAAAFLRLVR